MTSRSTPDLCDDYPDLVRVLDPVFTNFGGRESFNGPVLTVKCFEDNSVVKAFNRQYGPMKTLAATKVGKNGV